MPRANVYVKGNKLYRRKKKNKIQKLEKQVRRINATFEPRYHLENAITFTPQFNLNQVSILGDPAQGDTAETRTGLRISPYRLELHMRIRQPSTTSAPTSLRVILMQSKQGFVPSTISTTAVSQVFETPATAQTLISPFYQPNRHKFTLLYDKTYNNAGTTGPAAYSVNISKKLSRRIEYQEGSNVADKGQIYLLLISDRNDANGSAVQWYSKLHYKDD